MGRFAVGNAGRWMLAAWTLWTPVFTPPTVVHRHWGGGVPHCHDHGDRAPDGASHSLAPEGLPDNHEDGMGHSAADFHQHACLLLLGAVKYLPMPSEPVSPHGKSLCGWDAAVIVVSTAPGVRACWNGAVAGHFELDPPADLAVNCIYLPGQREIPPSRASPGSLLCDRARHERSGVLLA